MNTQRINLLTYLTPRKRTVLKAVCKAVSNKARASLKIEFSDALRHPAGRPPVLTDAEYSVTIDAVMAELPSSHHFALTPCYTISDTLDTLHYLYQENYINANLDRFSAIRPSDKLFSTIADEWHIALSAPQPNGYLSEKEVSHV